MTRRTLNGKNKPGIRKESNKKEAAIPDQQRISIVMQQMDIAALDVLVCRLPQNVLMLAGYWSPTGNSFAVFPRLADPVLIVPIEELPFAEESWIADIRSFEQFPFETVEDAVRHMMADIAREKGMQNLVVGYEGILDYVSWGMDLASAPGAATYHMLHFAFPAADFHDATEMLNEAQMVKTPREIAAIKIATELAGIGMHAADQSIAVGLRESEIASVVHKEILANGTGFKGIRDVRVFARAIAGVRSAGAYDRLLSTSKAEISSGDTILVEIEVCADGFWSQLTRTFIAGSPPASVQEAYDVCIEAQRRAVEAIVDGVKAGEVDNAVRAYVTKRGYGEEFKSELGHGIGFSVSPKSRPRFHAGSNDILIPYVVHTLEPGIFIDGLAGIKIGDVVADLGRGVEFFLDKA